MNRIVRVVDQVLARVAPSAPAHIRALTVALNQTPAPVSEGEARAGAGQTPEGEVAPGGSVTPVEQSTPRPPAPWEVELLNWRAHPAHRAEFSDEHFANLLTQWTEQSR